MSKGLKSIDFEGTIFFRIRKNISYLDELFHMGLISYKLPRGVRICDEIYKNCYQDTQNKSVIEKRLSNEYKISVATIRKIWNFMMQKAPKFK